MGSDKLVEITLDDANSIINLRDHRMLTEYTETGDLVITVFSKNEVVDTIKIKNSTIYKKRARLRL